tara:strand:- start:32375 stop:32530 length:156 start_codon:yes stop_codon:yes gene_type:complete
MLTLNLSINNFYVLIINYQGCKYTIIFESNNGESLELKEIISISNPLKSEG